MEYSPLQGTEAGFFFLGRGSCLILSRARDPTCRPGALSDRMPVSWRTPRSENAPASRSRPGVFCWTSLIMAGPDRPRQGFDVAVIDVDGRPKQVSGLAFAAGISCSEPAEVGFRPARSVPTSGYLLAFSDFLPAGSNARSETVTTDSIPRGMDRARRIIYYQPNKRHIENEFNRRHYPSETFSDPEFSKAFQSTSLTRSLVCFLALAPPPKCRMLRVFNGGRYWCLNPEFQNVNMRYVCCQLSTLPSLISLVWNLQTLVIDRGSLGKIFVPFEIWKMTQLRHIFLRGMSLPDPSPSDDKDDSVVMGNLQKLAHVRDFRLSEEACRRIPNIKKLHMNYGAIFKGEDCLFDHLQNLGRLQRLESITLKCYERIPISKLKNAFPSSLKKLSLDGNMVCFEYLSMMIGSLPQLEVLKLMGSSLNRPQMWSCVEGEFLHLKFLSINGDVLESWTFNDGDSHFPVLEKLVLINVRNLKEIPSGIGEIPTLQLIHLRRCTYSLAISARKIKEEQEYFGNYGLQIQVEESLGYRGLERW